MEGGFLLEFLQLAIAPLHRCLGIGRGGFYAFVDLEFGVERDLVDLVGVFLLAAELLSHAVLPRLQLAVEGGPVYVAIGRHIFCHAEALILPAGGHNGWQLFPGAVYQLLEPVFIRGKEIALTQGALAESNIGPNTGQPVVVHPEIQAPVVVFRLGFQVRVRYRPVPDLCIGVSEKVGNGFAAPHRDVLLFKGQVDLIGAGIIGLLHVHHDEGIFRAVTDPEGLGVQGLVLPCPPGGEGQLPDVFPLGFTDELGGIHIPAEQV